MTPEEAADLSKDPSRMYDWEITFPVFVMLVRSLKFHLLLDPIVTKKMFKELRLSRLLGLSAHVRFLRKLEIRKEKQQSTLRKMPESELELIRSCGTDKTDDDGDEMDDVGSNFAIEDPKVSKRSRARERASERGE